MGLQFLPFPANPEKLLLKPNSIGDGMGDDALREKSTEILAITFYFYR